MSQKQISLRSVVAAAALTALVTTLVSDWVPQLFTRIHAQITEKRQIVVNVKRDRQPISGVNISVSPLGSTSVISSGITDNRGIVVLNEIPREPIVIIQAVLREGFYERRYNDPLEINSMPYRLSLELQNFYSVLVGGSYPLNTLYPKCNSIVPRPKPNYFFIFRWTPIPEAVSYTAEIECLSCEASDGWEPIIRPNLGLRTRGRPIYSNKFYEGFEDHSFRWRVWAVDSSGTEDEKSNWCNFSFADGNRPPDQVDAPTPTVTPNSLAD